MKIEFFLKDGVLDSRALDGGVYVVDLLKKRSTKVIHLYVGEAGCIVKRCGTHLMEFSKNPEYFGIKEEYIDRDNLILRFTVYRSLAEKKDRNDENYKKNEKDSIKELKPVTQNPEADNDHMLYKPTKIKNVELKMKEEGLI